MAGKANFPLRMREPVMDAVKRLADDEFRSANAMIEVLVVEALKARGRAPRAEDKGKKPLSNE